MDMKIKNEAISLLLLWLLYYIRKIEKKKKIVELRYESLNILEIDR